MGRTGGTMPVPVLEVIGGGDAVAVSVVVCVVAPPVTDGVIVTTTVVITVDGDGEERMVVEVMVTVVTEAAERTPVLASGQTLKFENRRANEAMELGRGKGGKLTSNALADESRYAASASDIRRARCVARGAIADAAATVRAAGAASNIPEPCVCDLDTCLPCRAAAVGETNVRAAIGAAWARPLAALEDRESRCSAPENLQCPPAPL